jgi:hypothetical protein
MAYAPKPAMQARRRPLHLLDLMALVAAVALTLVSPAIMKAIIPAASYQVWDRRQYVPHLAALVLIWWIVRGQLESLLSTNGLSFSTSIDVNAKHTFMQGVKKRPPVPPTHFAMNGHSLSGLFCCRLGHGPSCEHRIHGGRGRRIRLSDLSRSVSCHLAIVPPAAHFRSDSQPGRHQYGHDRYRDHHLPHRKPHAKAFHDRSSSGCRLSP